MNDNKDKVTMPAIMSKTKEEQERDLEEVSSSKIQLSDFDILTIMLSLFISVVK